MEEKGVVREGKFVWKIHNFYEYEKYKSLVFRFGKYDCYLEVHMDDYDAEDDCCRILLCESNERTVDYNTFLNLSLSNAFGEEFVSTKRIVSKFDKSFQLMKIWYSDLRCKDNCLLPNHVLTLRMSWSDDKNSTCEPDNSEEESSKMLQTLSNDFVRFYENKEAANFSLRYGGKTKIPVHRVVLSARSKLFAAMLRNNRCGVADIRAVYADVLTDVLYYVYSGKTRGISADTIVPMYKVAERYDLIELKDVCLNVLMRIVPIEIVCEPLSHTCCKKKLEKAMLLIKEKWEETVKSRKRKLSNSEPVVAHKLRPLV